MGATEVRITSVSNLLESSALVTQDLFQVSHKFSA